MQDVPENRSTRQRVEIHADARPEGHAVFQRGDDRAPAHAVPRMMLSMRRVRPTRAASATMAPASACTSGSSVSDRKSTRLNSSHLVISYAVFCLKKKNTSEV